MITTKLTGEIGQLESYLIDMLNQRRNNFTEIEQLKKDRLALELTKKKLADLLAQSREAIIERDEEIKKLKTVSDEYERELETASMEYDVKCDKFSCLEATVSKLREEKEDLLNQIKTKSIVKQENDYFELSESNKVVELSIQLEEERMKVTGLIGLQEKFTILEAETSGLREKCKNQSEQIESKTEEMQSLQENLEKLKNVNKKLLIRKREYKRSEAILRADFELYKKKTKLTFKRFQKDIVLLKKSGRSGNSECKLKEDFTDSANTTNTNEYMSYANSENKTTEDFEESLKKIKEFKVPKLKRKEHSSDDARIGEIKKNSIESQPNSTLFIANLSYEVTSTQLTEHFSPFGLLEKVELPRKGSDLTKNKGCAWVTFKSGEEAAAAIRETNKQYFRGRQLSVRLSNGKR